MSLFHDLDADMWLAKRIAQLKGNKAAAIFDGVTDKETRVARFRIAILEHGLEEVIIGAKNGKCETFRAHFERRFGEKL